MDNRKIGMKCSGHVEAGHRLTVDRNGARAANVDEIEIGIAQTSGAGGTVIVKLNRESQLARVIGPINCGQALQKSAGGMWSKAKSGEGEATALEPVASEATIRILPN
jgi:hypothetical protein